MKKIDKVKWALYRAVEPTPERMQKAKWAMYGAASLTTVLLFAADGPNYPKIPRSYGD